MKDPLEIILNELSIIKEDLQFVKEELKKLNEKNESLEKDCSKMSEHIDFVDSVYEKVKYPLNYICKRYNNGFIKNGTE